MAFYLLFRLQVKRLISASKPTSHVFLSVLNRQECADQERTQNMVFDLFSSFCYRLGENIVLRYHTPPNDAQRGDLDGNRMIKLSLPYLLKIRTNPKNEICRLITQDVHKEKAHKTQYWCFICRNIILRKD